MTELSEVKQCDSESDHKSALVVTDSRSGQQYRIPVEDNYINLSSFKQISHGDTQMKCFDPGFIHTAICTSSVSWIDGDNNLVYRGYPLEVLCKRASFEKVAYLLIFGQLPTESEFLKFTMSMSRFSHIPESVKNLIATFPHDAHPMSIIISALSAMAAYNLDANPAYQGQSLYEENMSLRVRHVLKVMAAMPALCGLIYRHRHFMSVNSFDMEETGLGFAELFLCMVDRVHPKESWYPNERLAKALDILFTVQAENGLSCSTAAVRHVASAGSDIYTSVATGIAAMYGARHGSATEGVIRMFEKIGTIENVSGYIERVKKGEENLPGFGHRIYKYRDPRNEIIFAVAKTVFETLGNQPLTEVAKELEHITLTDEYFTSRGLFPNVDYYTGLVYQAMGLDLDFSTVLFALPRTAGWIAHWFEYQDVPDKKIFRPFQRYVGVRNQRFGTEHSVASTLQLPSFLANSPRGERRGHLTLQERRKAYGKSTSNTKAASTDIKHDLRPLHDLLQLRHIAKIV